MAHIHLQACMYLYDLYLSSDLLKQISMISVYYSEMSATDS